MTATHTRAETTDRDVARPVHEPTIADNGIPLLDPEPRRLGPVSRRLLARLVAGLTIVQIAGAVLTFGVATDAARSVGLSLTLPGGGFLYQARPVAFAVTWVLAVVALVLWWGLSFHLAIPMMWAGSAVAAFALLDAPRLVLDRGFTWAPGIALAYVLAFALVLVALGKFERRFRTQRAEIDDVNQYLATFELPEHTPSARTPDAMDAELLRWCYELAHQPDDGLKGLDWGEQFHGGTQLRYQLNGYSWALSMYAANFVPNAQSQATEAAARMIHKHTDLRAWRYWATLNLLGNFDRNPDPIVRDNIMFSAFLGDVLNIFEAATGDRRFDEPGSLTFVWKDGRTFPYDHHSIIEAVHDNYERSTLGFFPCEPGWSFTVCNVMGAQSMLGHDVHHGTELWDANRDRWRTTLENEYLTPDGTYAHIRSNHLGVSWDTGEVPGGHYTTHGTGRFSDILPAHGDRALALDLRRATPSMAGLSAMVVDGDLPMDLPEALERHRTSASALGGWTKIAGGGRLVGDDELVEAAFAGAARQCGTGLRWPDRPLAASSGGLGTHMLTRWATPLALADLNVRGYEAPTGPLLTRFPADDVIVLLARSDDDRSLDLMLEPWEDDAGAGTVTLGFDQLAPGARYTLDGVAIVADAEGAATAEITIDQRRTLRLELDGSDA